MFYPARSLAPLKHARAWFAVAYCMLVVVAVLSLLPAPDMPGSDKTLHLLTYFILSATFVSLAQRQRRLLFIIPGLVLYGLLLEVLQGLTGYRQMDSLDALANGVGVLAGALIRFTTIPLWFRHIERRYL